MTQGLYIWSKTAASNSNADSSINWAEGQAPSSVNDSSRAEMARLAEARDDWAGSLTTGGTSTAYTLSSNQVFDSLAHLSGQKLKVRFNAANGAAPTLNVDSLGAKAIQVASGVAVPTGAIPANSVYDVTYDNSIPAFLLSGGASAAATPVGFVGDFAGSVAPSLWLLCYGQAVSRTTYAALFAVISTTFGTGDGSTTFNVPDYRGRVGAGLDNMGGSAASRIGTALVTDSGTINGQTLGSTGGSQSHVQTSGEVGVHNHTATSTDSGHTHPQQANTSLFTSGGGANLPTTNPIGLEGGTTGSGTANISTTVNNGGSGNAMAWLQPTIMMNKIIYAGV